MSCVLQQMDSGNQFANITRVYLSLKGSLILIGYTLRLAEPACNSENQRYESETRKIALQNVEVKAKNPEAEAYQDQS